MRSFFTFLILSLVLLVFDFLGWLQPAKAWTEKHTNPIQQTIYSRIMNYEFRITNFTQSSQKLAELEKRVGELERENENLKIDNWKLSIENANSQRMLGSPLPSEWHFLPAQVIGQTRYLLINQGQRDGVKPDMIAIFENVLVGQVIEVSERTAKIRLPNDSESKIKAKTLRELDHSGSGRMDSPGMSGVSGILIGRNDSLLLTEVPQAEKFQVNDLVITSGEQEIFPPNLLIGKVVGISKDERQPTQQAEIEPLLDYSKLETVFLLIW